MSLQRRSQSEGPITRNPLFQSEYRLQFAIANQKRANREEAPARAKRDGSNNQVTTGIHYRLIEGMWLLNSR